MKKHILLAVGAFCMSAAMLAQNAGQAANQVKGNAGNGTMIQTQSQTMDRVQTQTSNNTAIQAQTRSRIHRQDQLHRQSGVRDRLQARDQLRKRDLSCLSGQARPSLALNRAAGSMVRSGNAKALRGTGVCRR